MNAEAIRARVRTRRRRVAALGTMTLATLSLIATLFGSGCVFDSGSYDGGGRRSSNTGSVETSTAPTTTSTSTPDASEPPDAGAPDV